MAVLCCAGCSATPVSVTRSMVSPLPIPPTAQMAPTDWMSIWAGAQAATVNARDPSGTSAVQIPKAQPELGALFLVAKKHLLIGASLHMAHSDWAERSNAAQLNVTSGVLVGGRVRVGFRFELGHPKFLLLGSLEPGLDVAPWTSSFTTRTAYMVLPAIGGSVTPAYETERVRVFAGVSAMTVPAPKLQKVIVPASCLFCDAPNDNYDGLIGVIAGARLTLNENVALTGSLTVPVVRGNLQLFPMFSLAVVFLQTRDAPQPAIDPEEPEDPSDSDPPLIEAPSPEEQQLQL